MKNNVKKILIVLSCIFTCVLPVNVFAAEDEVLECITDFLSTCQITSENLSVSESVPTYKDGKILTTDTNYIIFSENHVIGILTETKGIFTYMDLTDKSISNYAVNKVHAIEYDGIDILIYVDDSTYRISKDEMIKDKELKYGASKLKTENAISMVKRPKQDLTQIKKL